MVMNGAAHKAAFFIKLESRIFKKQLSNPKSHDSI